MQTNRRVFAFGALATLLSGCSSGAARFSATPSTRAETVFRAVPNTGWDSWVSGFKARAASQGINSGTIQRAFVGAGFLPDVIDRDQNQTEFKRSLEDYLGIAASDERVSKGRAAYARHKGTLDAIQRQYGVEGHVVAAVWGLESFFGERRGTVPVVSALSTLAFDGRRGAFFESQLIAALKILQNGDTTPANMTGSWAGAMGHTQFIPTSYLAYAVDFTGDGRRDIWADDPSDALASTAAYLKRSGWVSGQSWGGEVGSPGAQVGGRQLQPQPGGPVFVVGRNFDVIKRYNNSDSYAIGVGHLSDRILGRGPIQGAFPPDANGLTKVDRQRLQSRLTASGFDTDGTDGVIGPKSTAAITAFQASRGLAATGTPSPALLAMLG
ncbi:lytic murein transglycosylase [Oceaniovalibus sp. ACAM 378]|uniref:lytic murein transglycosylase n=1 Tax=Oceaniovalibus sp. ACAM 378 TaxID=2599923 RepID=UPI0011D62173|nr:lytic murein transglycosylase [Oceaniovalibus sp. ACAM 378]TYB91280.1 lytic murein transglycosylase [Oceaniovalibus sp. ACAM 378]